jgi:hypothetical protein
VVSWTTLSPTTWRAKKPSAAAKCLRIVSCPSTCSGERDVDDDVLGVQLVELCPTAFGDALVELVEDLAGVFNCRPSKSGK